MFELMDAKTVFQALGSAFFCLLGWLGKSLCDRVTRMENKHNACQSVVANRFADKAETADTLDAHEQRLDSHGERITKVESKVGL